MGNSRSPELSWISAMASLYTDTHSRLSSTSSIWPNFLAAEAGQGWGR